MPVRAARDDDHGFISTLDASLCLEGGEYPFAKPPFGSLFKKHVTGAHATSHSSTGEQADWDIKFYIIEAQSGVRAGFAVTSNWLSTDELSQKAGLTTRDIRLWFVGVQDIFRDKGLAQTAIHHIIDEPRPNNEPGSAFGVYETKLAARLPRSSVGSSDLLENYFDFDPQIWNGETIILTCPIWRYARACDAA